jgi:hypothetical protein
VLELCTCARRRPTAPVGSLGPGEAPALACCHQLHPLTVVHLAAAATAAGPRRRSPPCLPSGLLPPLGQPVVQPSCLPGRDRRRLAGLAGPAPPLPGQGSNCIDSNLVRVFRVKVQGLFVKIPI